MFATNNFQFFVLRAFVHAAAASDDSSKHKANIEQLERIKSEKRVV